MYNKTKRKKTQEVAHWSIDDNTRNQDMMLIEPGSPLLPDVDPRTKTDVWLVRWCDGVGDAPATWLGPLLGSVWKFDSAIEHFHKDREDMKEDVGIDDCDRSGW